MPRMDLVKSINKAQKVLVYGPPKVGKTEYVGRLAEAGFQLIWLDLEGGATTLINRISNEGKKNIWLINVPDTREMPRAAETVSQIAANFQKPVKIRVCDLHGRISCPDCTKKVPDEFVIVDLETLQQDRNYVLVIDSLTQLDQSIINYISRKKDPLNYANLLDGFDKFEWDDWGDLGIILRGILQAIQAAPLHIIVISHETEVKMTDGSEKIVPAGGTRNFARSNAKYFDHVLYMQVSNNKHTTQSSTLGSSRIIMGTRSGLDTKKGATLVDILNGKVNTEVESDMQEITLQDKEKLLEGTQAETSNLLAKLNKK